MNEDSQTPVEPTDGRAGFPEDASVTLRPVSGSVMLNVSFAHSDGAILGRSDSKSSYVPDIDLAELQALERGVSRRHAALVRYQNRLHVVDLSSVNGTFLNNRKLPPETPYLLNPGDQLKLGDLVLTLSPAAV